MRDWLAFTVLLFDFSVVLLTLSLDTTLEDLPPFSVTVLTFTPDLVLALGTFFLS